MQDPRFKQANKEAFYAIALSLLYFFLWLIFAYLLPDNLRMFGFPLWFSAACLLTPLYFILMTYFIIHWLFKDMSLNADNNK